MTFAAPLFLLAVLAGGIPVLLHMINRQKAPIVPFSTLRFLKLSAQRTRRRKYLHDVLLMLLRVAALVLLAIALSRPMFHHLGGLLGRKAASAVVIILDNSASMDMTDQSGPRWQVAMRAAEQLLEQVGDGDLLALLPTCGPTAEQHDRLYRNHEVVRQALAACQLSYEQADLTARLQTARKILEDAPVPNKEIYVFTDMQAVSWPPLKAEKQADQPSERTPIVVVDVHGAPLPNVGLAGVEVNSAAPVAGMPVQATVRLQGDANIAQQRHLELHLNGRQHDISPTLSLEAGATASHTFQLTLDRAGLHRGEIRLVGDDASARDDRQFFALLIDPHIPVALVKAENKEIPYLEDTFYVERALTPTTAAGWAIRPTVLTPAALATEPLDAYAVVFCVNLPAPDASNARRLLNYVKAGGHLVWICGENVDPVQYTLMNDLVEKELVPIRLTAVVQTSPDHPDAWHIGSIDEQHPALQPFVEPASLYQSVLIHKFLQMAPGSPEGTRVLARLDDGQPLLVQRSVGAGSIHLLATSVHVDWSNFPLRPIFMPLLSRLTFHLADVRAVQPHLVAGTPLVIPRTSQQDTLAQVVGPAGEAVQIKAEEDDAPDADADADIAVFRFADTHDIGIYQVELLEAARPRKLAFALNADPAEANVNTVDRAKFQEQLGQQTLVFCDDPNELTATITGLREGESFWEPFLIAVLIALVVETFLANRRVGEPPTPDQRHTERPRRTFAYRPKRLSSDAWPK